MAKVFSSLESLRFFLKIFCFQQPLRCFRNDLLTSTVIVRIPCGPLKVVPWRLSRSIIRENSGQKTFFTGKFAFFFKSLCFQRLLSVEEMILYLPQQLSEHRVDPYICLLMLLTLDIARKYRQDSFIHWKGGIFFENSGFQQPLRCYRIDHVNSTVVVRIPCSP